jgi:hypothetical protein
MHVFRILAAVIRVHVHHTTLFVNTLFIGFYKIKLLKTDPFKVTILCHHESQRECGSLTLTFLQYSLFYWLYNCNLFTF